MFELSIALKYLIPRRKQLSVALIALMSVLVISLVVWLVLVFLSVTAGIERTWLEKLTTLHAPVRITPTSAYTSSYYYNIDALASASQFRSKTIGQKAIAQASDPYAPGEDETLPFHFPAPDRKEDGTLVDPVKVAYQILSQQKSRYPGMAFQDYEMAGALLRLQMLRPADPHPLSKETHSFLTQVSYVATFADKSPYVASLVQPPRIQDLNHLFFLASRSLHNPREDAPQAIEVSSFDLLSSSLRALTSHSEIRQIKKAQDKSTLPLSLLPKEGQLRVKPQYQAGKLVALLIPTLASKEATSTLKIIEGKSYLDQAPLPAEIPLLIEGPLTLKASWASDSVPMGSSHRDLQFQVSGSLQGCPLQGIIPWKGWEIAEASIATELTAPTPSLPWLTTIPEGNGKRACLPINSDRETGVLLAKNFQDNGVLIGDRGYLSYTTASLGAVQEQRLPIFVSGFYDPGVLSVGNKCILAPNHIVETINASSSSFNLDPLQSNGIQVWLADLNQTEVFKGELTRAFKEAGIDRYWKITTFREFDFAKDLLQQFQSDKYLFTLVGGIILIVACCNIISLLVLLVNDKKQQIGILQAMGASSRSIALIFGTAGAILGTLSSLIGTFAALYTLHHIDQLVHLLSLIQGQDAFNAAFYGHSLPNQLSPDAVVFVLIATPILSLCAGLVPAIKACRLRPSAILRSE